MVERIKTFIFRLLGIRKPVEVDVKCLSITADIEVSMKDKYVIVAEHTRDGFLSIDDFNDDVHTTFNLTRKFIRLKDKSTDLPVYVNIKDVHKFYIRNRKVTEYTVKEIQWVKY